MPHVVMACAAADHARLLGEIRETGRCGNRPMQAYSQMLTDDGRNLHLRVVYAPERVIRQEGMPDLYLLKAVETYVFSAEDVRYLEGQGRSDDDKE